VLLGIETFNITTNTPSGDFSISISSTFNLIAENSYTSVLRETSGTGQITLKASANTYAEGDLNYSIFNKRLKLVTNRDILFKTYIKECNSENTVSLPENSFTSQLTILTNPTSGYTSLNLGQILNNGSILISDITGKEVIKLAEFNSEMQLTC